MIVGYVGRVFFDDSIAWVIIGSTVVSVGTAIAYAAMPTLIMGAVPITETASANGLNSLVRAIGTSTSSAAIAAVFTSVTIAVGDARLPSFDAFQDIFWLAAAASAASMLAAVFIPRAAGVRRPPATVAGAAELVVQGRVLAPDHRPLTPPSSPFSGPTAIRWTGAAWTRRATTPWPCPAPGNTYGGQRGRLGPDGRSLRLRRPHPNTELHAAGTPGARRLRCSRRRAGCRRDVDAPGSQRRASGHHPDGRQRDVRLPLPIAGTRRRDNASPRNPFRRWRESSSSTTVR